MAKKGRTAYQTISTATSTTSTTFATDSTTIVITSLITSTTTVPLPVMANSLAKRDLQSVPSYLSPCSNLARLSSACSCAGYTTSTVTTTTTLSPFVCVEYDAPHYIPSKGADMSRP